ncbi:MAG: glyoxalase/Bleomycin resistance/Dioxygenase superfamily protein [Hydrocarboniphaga sp.]|uniref:VOC family protein n=1 Tax=Hydrocarboniphaga sp. TaxID=2033016 RepID=UPI00261DB6FF|nr:VOC family protein [Hydrocarboniphaga sp.]MDB5970823.1 glyoxalase/Bleomycin resistance/Dioxygenase superfamily protein [Hydrocarboniphaga sp.]
MPVIGFDHYNLRAEHALLDRLRDFYVDVVGLARGARPPFRSFGYWLYVGEQAVLHLSEASPLEGRAADVVGTFSHVAFACTGLGEIEARLQRNRIDYTIDRVPLRDQIQLFFSDPAGNGVELSFAAGAV